MSEEFAVLAARLQAKEAMCWVLIVLRLSCSLSQLDRQPSLLLRERCRERGQMRRSILFFLHVIGHVFLSVLFRKKES